MSVKAKNQITIFTSIDPEEVETRFEQTDEKFSWLVKSGTSATDFELTDRVATLISPKVVIKASADSNAATIISGGVMNIDTIFAQDITATGTIRGANLSGSLIDCNSFSLHRKNTTGTDALTISANDFETVDGYNYNMFYIYQNAKSGSIRRELSFTYNAVSLECCEYSPSSGYMESVSGLYAEQSGRTDIIGSKIYIYGSRNSEDKVASVDLNGTLDVSGTINGCEISGIETLGGSFVHGGGVALDYSNSQHWAEYHPSFVGSIKVDSTWYNYISVRHQNGQSDGNKYGMRFWSNLHSFGDLKWQQQVDSWGTEKVIVDNSNIGTYLPTATPGTKGGAQMLSGYFKMKAIAAGKYGDKTYEFSSGTFSGTPSGVVCIRNASPGTSVSGNAARSVVLTGTTKTSISVRAYNNSTSSWTPEISYILIYRG